MDDSSDVPCCGDDGDYCGEEWGITGWIDICDCTDFFRVEGDCLIDLATGSGGTGDIYTYSSSVCVGESGAGVRHRAVDPNLPEDARAKRLADDDPRAVAHVRADAAAIDDAPKRLPHVRMHGELDRYGCTDVAAARTLVRWVDGFGVQVVPGRARWLRWRRGRGWRLVVECDSNGTYTAEEVYALSHTPAPSAAPTISSAPSVTFAPTSMCQVRRLLQRRVRVRRLDHV